MKTKRKQSMLSEDEDEEEDKKPKKLTKSKSLTVKENDEEEMDEEEIELLNRIKSVPTKLLRQRSSIHDAISLNPNRPKEFLKELLTKNKKFYKRKNIFSDGYMSFI